MAAAKPKKMSKKREPEPEIGLRLTPARCKADVPCGPLCSAITTVGLRSSPIESGFSMTTHRSVVGVRIPKIGFTTFNFCPFCGQKL